MVSGVNGAHGRSVAKAAMVEKQQEPDIAIILLRLAVDLTVLGTHSRLRIAMSKIALLMVNGVSGAHGRVVPRPVVVEKQQEPENAMLPRQLRSRGPAPEIPNVLPANPYRSRELQRDLREIHIQHAQQQAQPPRNAP